MVTVAGKQAQAGGSEGKKKKAGNRLEVDAHLKLVGAYLMRKECSDGHSQDFKDHGSSRTPTQECCGSQFSGVMNKGNKCPVSRKVWETPHQNSQSALAYYRL